MVLDDLLDLALQLRRDLAGRDLLKERALRRREVLAELALPLGDLVDGDGVELGGITSTQQYSVSEPQGTLTRPLTPAKMIGT